MTTIEVVPVSDNDISILPNVPKELQPGMTDVILEQQKFIAKKIANKFNLDYKELVEECIPKYLTITQDYTKSTKKTKNKKFKLENYKDAKNQEELKSLKNIELKKILKENNCPVSGNKKLLITRVWNLLSHNNDFEKTNSNQVNNISDEKNISNTHEQEVIECEIDLDSSPSIFVNKKGKICSNSNEGDEYKLYKNKYLFMENDDDIIYFGIFDGSNITFSNFDEYPVELASILGF